MSANDKFDRDFEEFLNEENSKLSAIYRKLPQDEPDAKVDAAVLAMAHRALNPELVAIAPRRRRRENRFWLPAFGLAAGVVLAAGIAMRLNTQYDKDRKDVRTQSGDVVSIRSLDAPSVPPPLSPPPPPAERVAAASAPKLAAKPESAPSPQPETATKAKTDDQASTNEPALLGVVGERKKSETAVQPNAFPAPAQPRRSTSEMDAVERKQAIAAGAWQNLHDRDSVTERERPSAPAAPATAPPPASVSSIAGASSTNAVAAPAGDSTTLSPNDWIAQIRDLLRAHRHDDAIKRLGEFRKQYPQYRLPTDLRDLH